MPPEHFIFILSTEMSGKNQLSEQFHSASLGKSWLEQCLVRQSTTIGGYPQILLQAFSGKERDRSRDPYSGFGSAIVMLDGISNARFK